MNLDLIQHSCIGNRHCGHPIHFIIILYSLLTGSPFKGCGVLILVKGYFLKKLKYSSLLWNKPDYLIA